MRLREIPAASVRRAKIGRADVEYLLVRRRGRRGVGLKVDATGLTVAAPLSMPLASIEAMLRESERWVLRKIAEWSERRVPVASWQDGSLLPYLGGSLTLRLTAGSRASARRDGGELRVRARNADAAG